MYSSSSLTKVDWLTPQVWQRGHEVLSKGGNTNCCGAIRHAVYCSLAFIPPTPKRTHIQTHTNARTHIRDLNSAAAGSSTCLPLGVLRQHRLISKEKSSREARRNNNNNSNNNNNNNNNSCQSTKAQTQCELISVAG